MHNASKRPLVEMSLEDNHQSDSCMVEIVYQHRYVVHKKCTCWLKRHIFRTSFVKTNQNFNATLFNVCCKITISVWYVCYLRLLVPSSCMVKKITALDLSKFLEIHKSIAFAVTFSACHFGKSRPIQWRWKLMKRRFGEMRPLELHISPHSGQIHKRAATLSNAATIHARGS